MSYKEHDFLAVKKNKSKNIKSIEKKSEKGKQLLYTDS